MPKACYDEELGEFFKNMAGLRSQTHRDELVANSLRCADTTPKTKQENVTGARPTKDNNQTQDNTGSMALFQDKQHAPQHAVT